jgi:hypothetical protein
MSRGETLKSASVFTLRADFSPNFQSEIAPPAPSASEQKSVVTRRVLMNSLVALPIAAAVPTAAPAMDFPLAPVSMPPLPAADRDLVQLAKQLVAAATESRRLNSIVD